VLHPQEHVKFYCVTCDAVICLLDVPDKSAHEAQYHSLVNDAQQQQDVQGLIAHAQTLADTVRTAIAAHKMMLSNVERNCDANIAAINPSSDNQIARFTDAINAQRRTLIA
jgi:hypothetical protein